MFIFLPDTHWTLPIWLILTPRIQTAENIFSKYSEAFITRVNSSSGLNVFSSVTIYWTVISYNTICETAQRITHRWKKFLLLCSFEYYLLKLKQYLP